jgi:hypothetical protein
MALAGMLVDMEAAVVVGGLGLGFGGSAAALAAWRRPWRLADP